MHRIGSSSSSSNGITKLVANVNVIIRNGLVAAKKEGSAGMTSGSPINVATTSAPLFYVGRMCQQQRGFASAMPEQQMQQQAFPSIVIGGKEQALEPQGSFAKAQAEVSSYRIASDCVVLCRTISICSLRV